MRRLLILIVAAGVATGSALIAAGAASATVAHDADAAALQITPSGVNGNVGAIISDATFRVSGTVTPYRAHVSLHVFRDGVRVVTRTLSISHRGREGVFLTTLRVGGVGRLTVRAIARATATRPAIISPAFSLWMVAPEVAPGQDSYAARILQYELSARHYVVGAPGVYDAQTQWAVMAFRKMADLPRTFVADASVFNALAAGAGTFVIDYPQQGRHIEADLTHQVIALIGANGVIQRLYAISSGKPSTPTQLGNFAVYWKELGTNNDGMVNSSFFNGGDAIHGYAEVPSYAASHGCLRVWIPDSLSIFDWVTVGTPVDVYYR
jgi:lipoprotein-anchoring transpeptidase ErfK/SrfK